MAATHASDCHSNFLLVPSSSSSSSPQLIDLHSINPYQSFAHQPFRAINPNFPQPLPFPFNPSLINPPVRFILNPYISSRLDEERSSSLLQFMADEGLVPSSEEEERRENVILKLKQIVLEWIRNIALKHQLTKEEMEATCATILTYGSYGLGVHGSESDIDALCVGPSFATMVDDFFIVLQDMLKSRPEVSEIHCIKDAKVPLMRFKFDGISIDLPYARLQMLSVPENVDVLNPFILSGIDETSLKSLSGVRANKQILQLVPNHENFQSMLRCVKLWAKRRGVYGNLFGLLGGVHLAILAAFVCQHHPTASLNALISYFFKTFALWPWPMPVMLQDGMLPLTGDAIRPTRSFMPIRLPCIPYEYCHSNITRSTFYKIKAEFLRGHNLTKDILRPDFNWEFIYEPFPYTKRYLRFVKIHLSASTEDELGNWVGWAKSRFRCLLSKLEEVYGFCDPNPTEYVDIDVARPNVVFYWGLNPGRSSFTDINYVEHYFMKDIRNGYRGPFGSMKLSIVHASQLPKCAQVDNSESKKETRSCQKILDYCSQQKIPLYMLHPPNCQVGYTDANGNPIYPSLVGGRVI